MLPHLRLRRFRRLRRHLLYLHLNWQKNVTQEIKSKDLKIPRQLETSARYSSRKDFYWRLDNFLEQRYGMSRRALILGGKKLDLYLLYMEVLSRGGYQKMDIEAKKKKGVWASVFRSLPNYNENETSASYRLRKSYEKYLLAFALSDHGVSLPRYTAESGYGRKKRKREPSQTNATKEKQCLRQLRKIRQEIAKSRLRRRCNSRQGCNWRTSRQRRKY